MTNLILSRRKFLQHSAFGALAFGLLPLADIIHPGSGYAFGRITTSNVRVRLSPSSQADVVYKLPRDYVVPIYETITVDGYRNPYWHRVWGGYLHSSYVQQVGYRFNKVEDSIPEGGCLFEVTVPHTRSYRLEGGEWLQNYRLYYNSAHWVTAVVQGPDGKDWYQIVDSYERSYYVRASHMRRVLPAELEPISPEVPRNQKWIEVSIGDQELNAFENGNVVLHTKISSGLPLNRPLEEGEIPTETPLGDHFITVKSVSRHMGTKNLTDALNTGAYPGVPYVSFFDEDGYSLHGTYWHSNFGNRMSHGCVNMRVEDAKWIYRWALPPAPPAEWETTGWGIRVSVRE